MLFTQKKKMQRDRDAGLVFRWRGGYKSNIGGSTIAFLLTNMIFAGSFVMLNISLKSSSVPNKYRASMVQLGPVDDQLEWWMEKNSPNLPIWESNGDATSEARVKGLLDNELNLARDPVYLYEEIELKEVQIDDQRYSTMDTPSLPSLDRLQSSQAEGAVASLEWKLSVTSAGELNERLPADLEYRGWIPELWRGLSVKFIVAVNAKGKVMTATPVEWTRDEVVKDLENWIYTISFQPLRGDDDRANNTTTGTLDLRYLSSEVKPDKEVKP